MLPATQLPDDTVLHSFDLYRVGGCVRDEILGLKTKDIDYTAVLKSRHRYSLTEMELVFNMLMGELMDAGFEVFQPKLEYLTIRAKFPVDHDHAGMTADFVIARLEGPYTDGRRPDFVKPGNILDDLRRRDFTMNAMSVSETGTLFDPFNGQEDMRDHIIRCVGTAHARLFEDALRGMRALRFSMTKNMELGIDIDGVLNDPDFWEALAKVSIDRRREEMERMFRHDTLGTIRLLGEYPKGLYDAMFDGGIWLQPSLKRQSRRSNR